MKSLVLAIGILGAGSLWAACGSDSGGITCDEGATIVCNKFDECGLLDDLGQTLQECIDNSSASCNTNNGCDAGETFHQDEADACIDAFDSASCSDLTGGTADLSACDRVCT